MLVIWRNTNKQKDIHYRDRRRGAIVTYLHLVLAILSDSAIITSVKVEITNRIATHVNE